MHNKIHSFVLEGRVCLDTLTASQQEKLDTYSLQNVCHALMGKSKLDISPNDMFRAYRFEVSGKPTDEDIIDLMDEPGNSDEDGAGTGVSERVKRLSNKVVYYCVKDSDLVADLSKRFHLWLTMMEYSTCFGVTPYQSLACGQQARCLSIVYVLASTQGYVLDHPSSLPSYDSSLVGGRVVPTTPGMYDFILCLDYNSLYPSIIQEKNICHTTYIPPSRWHAFKEGEYNAIQEATNEGNEEFRFSTKQRGIIPELCENLVTARRLAKKKMNESPKGSSLHTSMDGRQKALKITANSMYGLMGAKEAGALKLVAGSRSITCRGRELQQQLAQALTKEFDVVEVYGDTDSSMVTGRGNLAIQSGASQLETDGMIIANSTEAISLGKKMEDFINGTDDVPGVFRRPIRVELEKVMKMLVVHRKMYAYLEYSPSEAYRDERGKQVTSSQELHKSNTLPESVEYRATETDISRDMFDPLLYTKDGQGKPLVTTKGLLTVRRDACNACKDAFSTVLNLVLSNYKSYELLSQVSKRLRKFLTQSTMADFVKTVQVAGNYKSHTCPNNVFKRNMLKRGTKIEARSRVAYVIAITKEERESNRAVAVGDKMLLTKYYDPSEHQIDTLHYLRSGLKKSLDQVVPLGAPRFCTPVKACGLGQLILNRPVECILKLVQMKNGGTDLCGISMYNSLIEKQWSDLGTDR